MMIKWFEGESKEQISKHQEYRKGFVNRCKTGNIGQYPQGNNQLHSTVHNFHFNG